MLFKKIDPNSQNSITNALNVFEIPPTQVAFSSSAYREYLTLNPLNSRPFHFKIYASNSFLDMSKAYLMTEMRIMKTNANNELVNIDDNDNVAPIQMIGSTFIKNLKVSINNQEIYDSNSLQHYRSYLDTELSYSNGAKSTWLNSAGYYPSPSHPNSLENEGFTARKKLFKQSKSVQLITKINSDMFNQPLLMVPHVEIDIQVTPHEDDLVILAPGTAAKAAVGTAPAVAATADTNTYKLVIDNCRLYVKAMELMDSLSLDFNQRLDKSPATYSVRKSYLKSFFINSGAREFSALLSTDTIPRRVTLGLVDKKSFVGDKTKNPFFFKPFDLREITISAMGKNFPNVPYILDYPNGKFTRPYYDLMEAIGYANTPEDNGITRAMYENGWTLYSFNLTNSLEDEQYFELIKSGSCNINLKFNSDVPSGGVVLVAYLETDGLVMVDKNRALTSDNTI